MCVIFYSPEPGALPSLHQMRKMFKANPDGASFSFVKDGGWQTVKGFMSMKTLAKFYPTLTEATEVVGHFRLATHGIVSVENCHPFSVIPNQKKSVECKDQSKGGLLYHNGILRGFGSEQLSDTLHFTTGVLAKLGLKERMAILENTDGKFAYITPDGFVELFGQFDQDKYQCFFSNSYWDYSYGKSSVLQTQDISDNYMYELETDMDFAMAKDSGGATPVTQMQRLDEVEN